MPKVLVVDDDPNVSSLVRILLEVNDFEVHCVSSGMDALRLLGIPWPTGKSRKASYEPDLVVMDFEMPEPNGYQVLKRMREEDATRSLPVILVTATKKDMREMFQYDATSYLEKPFENAHLLALVRKVLPDAPAQGSTISRIKEKAPSKLEFEYPHPLAKAKKADSTDRFKLSRPLTRPPRSLPPAIAPQAEPAAEPPPAPSTPLHPAGRSQPPAPAPGPEAAPQQVFHYAPPPPEPPRPAPRPTPQPSPMEPHKVPDMKVSQELEINMKQLLMRVGDLSGLLNSADIDPLTLPENQKPRATPELDKDFSPVIKMVDEIIAEGIKRGASDIHFEPDETSLTIRMRVDGELQRVLKFPAAVSPKVAARLKIMASLDISERRLPQDGSFAFSAGGRDIKCRVSTLPAVGGEKVVLRLLHQGGVTLAWSSIGMSVRDRQCVDAILRSPQGIILVTGPTGSGKSTTLHIMLHTLNTPGRNIVTVEDPVEYRMAGITQVPVNPDVGMTFEKALRSFLRQDPNIILVGEMRDTETVEIGMRAAVTGHLVLSTLHTNSAPASITRLINMGIKPYMIAASLRLVIAQRLVRVLCPACKTPAQLAEEERLLLTPEELAGLGQIFAPRGCPQCSKSGFRGRQAIFEVMPLDSSDMKKMLLEGNEENILAQARKEGMLTLRKAALDMAAAGRTSMPEAMKVFFSH
ncbi:MAG: ATPase, T2SS/T4P/T4SS family [Elusimicrobiota bacterium]|jgi:type IV pilus assembly protein PilB